MISKRTVPLILSVVFAGWTCSMPEPSAAAQTAVAPHTREGCLHCHHSDDLSKGQGTIIFEPRKEGPHEVLLQSCRTCHEDGKNFWIIVLPEGRTGGILPSPGGAAPSPPVPSAGTADQEGFANSHDSLECTKCHVKDPGSMQSGLPDPFPYGDGGVGTFCRKCHEKVDRSHFPRRNRPRKSVTCLSCHQVHGNTPLFPALRVGYPPFLVESTGINPHGGTIFCLACHLDSPQGGQAVNFRHDGRADALCQRCHREIEHHPLGVASSPGTWKMDFSDFPLEEEKITCVTCHDPYECDSAGTRDDPRFLRGGPYNAVEEFCKRCHEGRSFTKINPHDQIDDKGQVLKKKCLYCHVTVPESGGLPLGEENFTDNVESLCASCHQVGPHPEVDHTVEIRSDMREKLRQYEEERLVSLPLAGESLITCATCHNPHERGLLKGASGIGADENMRLRLATLNEICSPCHGRH